MSCCLYFWVQNYVSNIDDYEHAGHELSINKSTLVFGSLSIVKLYHIILLNIMIIITLLLLSSTLVCRHLPCVKIIKSCTYWPKFENIGSFCQRIHNIFFFILKRIYCSLFKTVPLCVISSVSWGRINEKATLIYGTHPHLYFVYRIAEAINLVVVVEHILCQVDRFH